MIKTWSFDYKIPTLNLTSNLTVIILSSKMLQEDSRVKFSLHQSSIRFNIHMSASTFKPSFEQ